MEAFLATFGMHRSARTDDALYMRGTDRDHHVHVTHLGEPAFLGIAFTTGLGDLHRLAAATGTEVEALDEPGGGRVDRPADHHTLLLLETGEVRLGHCAWEVADLDDLMAGHDHLLADERRHYWGIGRHILGGQIFDYWKDPLGFTVEHWTDSDLLTSSVPAGSNDLSAALNQWGPPPPADLDF